MHFVWAQFSELFTYLKTQANDDEKLNAKLAEMIALLTCGQPTSKKSIGYSVTSGLKEILSRINGRVKSIYSSLPRNAMLVICTGHGDTAVVHR